MIAGGNRFGRRESESGKREGRMRGGREMFEFR
jgi:hypothetical protein